MRREASNSFGLVLDNVPLVNSRAELRMLLERVPTRDFDRLLIRRHIDLEPFFTWEGPPHELLTQVVQRVILGLEGYLPGAVVITAANAGKGSAELERKVRNPFALGGRTVVDNYFNRLPGLLSPAYSLRAMDRQLWARTCAFYAEVRNPLFHGKRISALDVPPVEALLKHVDSLYRWVDSWSF